MDDKGYMNSFKTRFEEVLELLKDKDGTTIKTLAEDLGFSIQTLYYWKNEGRKPRYDELTKLIQRIKQTLPDFDSDYLLCLSNNHTKGNQSINEQLGLDDEAIGVIRNIKSDTLLLDPLCDLIRTPNFQNLLTSIDRLSPNDYEQKPSMSYEQWKLHNEFMKCVSELSDLQDKKPGLPIAVKKTKKGAN